jgi:cytochrome P450
VNPRSLHDRLLYPHACFSALHDNGPVVYNAAAKMWEVFDYEDVRKIASDYETFSSDTARFASQQEELFHSLINVDPPRHRQLRSLVSQAFTPRTIALLAPRIAEITHSLLDEVVESGSMDVITDLAYPLPVIVIAELLGIPIEERANFKRWSDNIVAGEYEDFVGVNQQEYIARVRETVRRTLDEIYGYFRHIIAQRRARPQHDLISDLLAARIEGESLTEQELLSFCTLLLVAGNITTTNLIGNAILCFDEQPEVMDQLRDKADLMPQALEEVLRYRPPVVLLFRVPTKDVMLCNQQVQRGQFVMTWLAAANHDATQFPHPERFDIMRNPNRHLTFGHGIHFCLGAPLARLEASIVLNIMLERLHHIQRDRDQPVVPVQSTFIYGIKHLPITFATR